MCPLPAPSTGAVDVSRSAPSSAFPRANAGAVERTQHPPRAPPAPGAKGRIVPSMTATPTQPRPAASRAAGRTSRSSSRSGSASTPPTRSRAALPTTSGDATAFENGALDHRLPAQPRLDDRADAPARGRVVVAPRPGDLATPTGSRSSPSSGSRCSGSTSARTTASSRFRNTLIVGEPDRPRRLRARCRRRRRACSREAGFTDTLAAHATVTHDSSVVQLRRESVRGDAEPALRGRADRRHRDGARRAARWAKVLWLAWPAWVWFSVMATGNHFWLDIAAGVLVAGVAAAIVYRPLRRLRLAGMSLKEAYTAGRARRSPRARWPGSRARA